MKPSDAYLPRHHATEAAATPSGAPAVSGATPLPPALYLLPVGLSGAPLHDVLPDANFAVASRLRHFIVENLRTARRFLRRCDPAFDVDGTTFFELNTRTDRSAISRMLDPLRAGHPMGLMSEAGCPAVADPGSDIVAIAQKEGLRVVPLVGPSSILMSLMASGFNGQGFCFNGYLPIEEGARVKKIRELENIAARQGITQIFIETPYRNNAMLRTLAATLRPDTLLCVACDITDPVSQSIRTLAAARWKTHAENYDKRPAVFLIHRNLS